MEKIGVIVCNYNKEDYIIKCIRSILSSSVNNFDVYVVDNASTDCSVERIQKEFKNKVQLLVNKENRGGSGGFNTGLREALKKNYKYLLLFDNDIIIERHAIEELYYFLEAHENIGMVGSKVYFMDYPERIWGYGGNINFEKYIQEDNYKNCIDDESIPELLYCDYVAACSLMVRTDVVRKIGVMPENNFIYWDDMEWGYRFNQAGYKVAVWGKSKIWHKAGGRNAGNTFINYYMWRNRIRFFLKVLQQDKKEDFAEVLLNDMFRLIYSCNLKGELNIVKSVMYALDDAINNVGGKAAEYKILFRNSCKDRVSEAIGLSRRVLISFNGDLEGLGNIVRKLESIQTIETILINLNCCNSNSVDMQKQFPKCRIVNESKTEQYDYCLNMCSHIFNIGKEFEDGNYIDPWCNIVNGKNDMDYCKDFSRNLSEFYNKYKNSFINNDKYTLKLKLYQKKCNT